MKDIPENIRERKRQSVRESRARDRDLKLVMAENDVVFDKSGFPVVKNLRRKELCRKSLARFAKTYQPSVFNLKMSAGQIAEFSVMQRACIEGGRFAFADPRGDGKTSRTETAILHAALYGLRKCIVIVGADLGAAQQIMESIKLELRTNEKLREDFPVPCWAAMLSDDTALKAKTWTWKGESLAMRWGRGGIVLPVLDGADGSGCVIVPRGLTGRLRGMRLKVGKKAVRPDLFAIDDPQTDESASSRAQVDTRESLILGSIMGSAGPAASIAAMMPCTIIKFDDLASRFLDHKRHPDWQGSVRGLVKTWPDSQKTLWKTYQSIRRNESHDEANAFYKANRKAMDAGAVMDWPQRYTHGKEVSAIQHAENLLCDLGEEIFQAEYMNAPQEKNASIYDLNSQIVASRVYQGRNRFDVPDLARIIVAATDLNHYGLHSVALAFQNDQTGSVLWYFRHDNNGLPIIPKNAPEAEAKARMFEALVKHGKEISELPLMRTGQRVRPGVWVVDGGYMHDVAQRYVDGPARQLGLNAIVARGFSADKYRPGGKGTIGKPREGCHYTESAMGRFVAWNADYWREISQRAWLGTPGAPGAVSLFDGARHSEFADQVTREKLIEKLRGQFGPVWRWHTQPGWHDYGDAMAMAYMGAAWGGIGTTQAAQAPAGRYIERRKCKFQRES